MNTSSSRKLALGASALIFSSLLSVSAFAGPGPQFWQAVGTAKKAPAVVAAPAATAHGCAGATVVPVTAMNPALPNGRGHLVAKLTGTKTVCHMCPVETVVTTNSLPNGRGALVKTSVTKTGVEHTCTTCASLAKL